MGWNLRKPKPQAGGQITLEGLQRLKESFARVFSGRDAFEREYLLVEEAKQWDVPLDEYRKLYESYCSYAPKGGLRKFRLSTLPRFQRWTGFGEKKLWDYLQLAVGISIPIVIFIAGQWFNEKQQQIANERYGQDLLSKYFDQMTDLITTKHLLSPSKDDPKEQKESQTIARARTLSTLRELGKDRDRKGLLIKFLYEANLIQAKNRAIKLETADIKGADLYVADLRGAKFRGTDLYGANLYGADLYGADLGSAEFRGANLRRTDLYGANLFEANLSEQLRGACLKQANNLTTQQVKSAKNWQAAYYSPDFRKQLGLPPDTRTPPKGCTDYWRHFD